MLIICADAVMALLLSNLFKRGDRRLNNCAPVIWIWVRHRPDTSGGVFTCSSEGAIIPNSIHSSMISIWVAIVVHAAKE